MKKDLASVEWLSQHYKAKSAIRTPQLVTLPIYPGDKVLDIGCGAGLYTEHFSDMVGSSGSVVGVDRAPEVLEYARRIAGYRGSDILQYMELSFESDIDIAREFDVVVFMNSLGYFSDPGSLIENILDVIPVGGRVFIKDYDMESVFVSPVVQREWYSLLINAKQGNDENNPYRYNNFFPRELTSIAIRYPNQKRNITVWPNVMTYPFTKEQVVYMKGNVQALLDQARSVADDPYSCIEATFIADDATFYKNPKAVFSEDEYVLVITKIV